jgi:hypothetical protein
LTRVMSLDLGITTGWCVRDTVTEELVARGTVGWPENNDVTSSLVAAFQSLVQRYLPSHVVIEAPVIENVRGELGGKLSTLITAAKVTFKANTDWVTPAQWKPRFGTHPLPADFKPSTTHERDSYRILQWWLNTRRTSTNVKA